MLPFKYIPNSYSPTFPESMIMGFVERFDVMEYIEVDKKVFTQLLLNSLSLSLIEKERVFSALPTLTQFQVDELLKVFLDESAKFAELYEEHPDDLCKLVAKNIVGVFSFAVYLGVIPESKADEQKLMASVVEHYQSSNETFYEQLKEQQHSNVHINLLFSTLSQIDEDNEQEAVPEFLSGVF